MFEGFSNFFRAIAEYFGWKRQRDAERNAPNVRAAKIAEGEQAEVDAEIKATADRDVAKTREELSEN